MNKIILYFLLLLFLLPMNLVCNELECDEQQNIKESSNFKIPSFINTDTAKTKKQSYEDDLFKTTFGKINSKEDNNEAMNEFHSKLENLSKSSDYQTSAIKAMTDTSVSGDDLPFRL